MRLYKTKRVGPFILGVATLPTNFHGRKGATLSFTVRVVQLGLEPLSWRSWRLYFYGRHGWCINFDYRYAPREHAQ